METKTKYPDIISLFLSKDELRPAMMLPSLIDGYVWATDGHAMIRLDRDAVSCDVSTVDGYPDAVKAYTDVLNATELSGTLKSERLIDLFSKLPLYDVFEDCPDCEGEGKIICECCDYENDCRECSGTGHTGKVIGQEFGINEKVNVGNQLFSANLLKRIHESMSLLGEEDCDLFQPSTPFKGAIIKMSRAQILLMPMHYDSVDESRKRLNIS